MNRCMLCGERAILYYIGNDNFGSPIYYCYHCKVGHQN